MKNAMKLSRKIQLRKKSTIFNVIFITLAVLIVFSFQSYAKSANNYLESGAPYNSVYFNSLEVGAGEKADLDEVINKLKKMKHITIATYYYNYTNMLFTDEFDNSIIDGGYLYLHIANNESLPKLTYGTKFPEKVGNYLICPQTIYKTDNMNKLRTITVNQTIDMRQFLNKKLTFHYSSNNASNTYNKDFTIIGLYEPSNFFDFDVCFAQEETMNNIVMDQYSDDIDETTGENNINLQRSLFVLLDDMSNKDEVYKQLDEAGLYHETNSQILPEYYENINNTSNMVTIIVISLLIAIIFIITYKQFNEDKKTYKLLHYLGYKQSEMQKILISSSLIQVALAIILSSFITFIFYLIFKLILSYYPFLLYSFKLCLSISSIILVYVIIFITSIIGCFINIHKLKENKFYENSNI